MLKKALISIVLTLTILFTAQPAFAKATLPKIILSQSVLAEWQKVAQCEEGGNWNTFSYWYPDALGIDRPNFIQFGGNPGTVGNPHISARAQQILVGQRMINHYNIGIPDQLGWCAPW